MSEIVTKHENRYVVQCQTDDGDWYDFGVFSDKNEAQANFGKTTSYRKGIYRLVWRTTRDVQIIGETTVA